MRCEVHDQGEGMEVAVRWYPDDDPDKDWRPYGVVTVTCGVDEVRLFFKSWETFYDFYDSVKWQYEAELEELREG